MAVASESVTAASVNAAPRLTLQCETIATDTSTIRCLDWDRSRFDIEFGLRNGTTYNSYLVRGAQTVLIDTSHLKFEQTWLELLQQQ
ncbi:MAG: diflavin flavoprotein A, partial [Prochlorococcus sp.]